LAGGRSGPLLPIFQQVKLFLPQTIKIAGSKRSSFPENVLGRMVRSAKNHIHI
jgi:hypothetical protein